MQEKQEKYSIIIDGAYGLVIAQNIVCFSRATISFCKGSIDTILFFSIILIAILNFSNLIANWISSRATSEVYSNKLFVLDTLSLSIMAIFTQLIADSFDEKYNFLLFDFKYQKSGFAFFYFILYISFFIWNIVTASSKQNTEGFLRRVFSINNLLIAIYCIVLALVCVLDFMQYNDAASVMFWIAIAYSYVIVIKYFILDISK